MKLIEYLQKDSFVHALDARTKLIALTSLSTMCLISTSLQYQALMFSAIFAIILLSRLPLKNIFYFSKPFLILSSIVLLIQAFSYPLGESIIFSVFSFDATAEGLLFGTAIAFRLLSISFAVALFIMTTKPKDTIESLGNHLPGEIAFVITAAFRFIPILQSELETISRAQFSRGVKKNRFTWYFALSVPLLAKAFMRARYLSFSVESRAFNPQRRRMYEKRFYSNDFIAFAALAIFVFVLLNFR